MAKGAGTETFVRMGYSLIEHFDHLVFFRHRGLEHSIIAVAYQ